MLGQSWAGMQEPGYHQGLQGLLVPPRAQTPVSPHDCLAGDARCSRGGRWRELESLLVSLSLLTPSPPTLSGGCREGSVPVGLHAHDEACKSAVRPGHLSSPVGRSPQPSFAAQPCSPRSPSVPASGAHAPPQPQLCIVSDSPLLALGVCVVCAQRFGEGPAHASPGCMSGFSLSPLASHLVPVAHPPSATRCHIWPRCVSSPGASCRPAPRLTPCPHAARVPDAKRHLRPALPSKPRRERLLAEVSLNRRSAGKGALMRRACALASLFNSEIRRLSEISQWEEQQQLKLLRLVLIAAEFYSSVPG